MRELRFERYGIWIDLGRVNLMWQVLEKTKKNLSASPISLYIIDSIFFSEKWVQTEELKNEEYERCVK
jgi:hypothetical protein